MSSVRVSGRELRPENGRLVGRQFLSQVRCMFFPCRDAGQPCGAEHLCA